MSDIESNLYITNSNTRKYAFINKKGKQFEAILEWHSNDDLETAFISNSSFKELANNLEINLEELHFKYSPISTVCEHGPPTFERCYSLERVFSIFSELKAGMVLMDEGECCNSKLPLCSQEFRDSTYWWRTTENTPVFFNFNRACLLDEKDYLYTSRQRLISRGDIFSQGVDEYTLSTNPSRTDHWLRHFKKRDKSIKLLLRLDKYISLIYKDKDNLPGYY
jgi:hypothetical protein